MATCVGFGSSTSLLSLRQVRVGVRASWDLRPDAPSIPDPTPKPKTNTLTKPSTQPHSLTKPSTSHPSQLFDLNNQLHTLSSSPTPLVTEQGEDEKYLGYDRWLPAAPKVKKPRSIYNAASLAYIGDCIYELYARRHFLFPPLNIEEYNGRVGAVVRCEAQDALLKKLLEDGYLSEEERDVLRWGKNLGSGKTKTKKRAGVAVYNRASSLETLIGFLYLTDVERLEDVMQKLGFITGASSERILASLMVLQ